MARAPKEERATRAVALVKGPAQGRWRGGPGWPARKFGPEPTAIDLGDLPAGALAALQADPHLMVVLTEVDDDPREDGAGTGPGATPAS